MIDTNPESSFSESASNSMLSKTPTSITLAGDLPKELSMDANQSKDADKTSTCLSIPAGCVYQTILLNIE